MHDTSTESQSKWRTVGAKRNDSSILSPLSMIEGKKQTKKYRPSKQKQLSNSRIFNRGRSKFQSLDNIPKDDLSETNSQGGEAIVSARTKTTRLQAQRIPGIRINSMIPDSHPNEHTHKSVSIKGNRSSFAYEKEFLAIKQDYTKFKQKVLSQLDIQKQNITKLINQILSTVKRQLIAIQQKYNKNTGQAPSLVPSFSTPSLMQLSSSKSKLHDISVINHTSAQSLTRNHTEKSLIAGLNALNAIGDDPIASRFSRFYSTIQKMKSDLDGLHQISANQSNDVETSETSFISPLTLQSNANSSSTLEQGFSAFLKI